MTAPDPHDLPPTRRALREARERRSASPARPAGRTPAIFKAPPPPVRRRAAQVVTVPFSAQRELTASLLAEPADPLLPTRPVARHVRRRPRPLLRFGAALALAAMLVAGSSAAVTAALAAEPASVATAALAPPQPVEEIRATLAAPAPATAAPPLIADAPSASVEPAGTALCDKPAVVAALAAGDDVAAIAAAGGADAVRAAVASQAAPCIDLADPARTWVVVDKIRPLNPVDYAPGPLVLPDGVRSLEGGELRADAGAAMSAMIAASRQAGAGDLAMESAYRSYTTQVTSYGNQVSARGTAGADLVSARPGYSEHQTALAADLVACTTGGCGTLDDLAATSQGQWLAAHSWEHGWIVRYEAGHTDVSGYNPEPWHLRYIGVDLARSYHEGGWHTLEEFFGLPAAPGYTS